MSNQLVSKALSTHLNTLPSKPPIAWENASYTPVTGTLYLKENTLFASDDAFTLADGDSVMKQGIYQVTVIAPASTTKFKAMDMTDKISEHFARGTVLVSGSISVRIKHPSVSPAINLDGWCAIPVSIPYTVMVK